MGDGRSLEEAMADIHEQPGTGDYDVILQFPFPAIEIIRYGAGDTEQKHKNDDGKHWFTLDNRRLYCLQRVAAAFWPRRVAAAVEILYASPGSVRRKYDTTTYGHSVALKHATKDVSVGRWDWKLSVQPSTPPSANTSSARAVHLALAAVESDDAKPVSELLDVANEASSAASRALAQLWNGSLVHENFTKAPDRAGTPSTEDPSGESDRGSADTSPRMYENTRWDINEWDDGNWPCSNGDVNDYAWWAIKEIKQQLNAPGNSGYVWISNWNKVYASYLGTLRTFIESRPDHFVVIPGYGKGYRVSLAHQLHESAQRSGYRGASTMSYNSWPSKHSRHSTARSQWSTYA